MDGDAVFKAITFRHVSSCASFVFSEKALRIAGAKRNTTFHTGSNQVVVHLAFMFWAFGMYYVTMLSQTVKIKKA